jgi:energy-coupling factor transporter ATP-binding protein EcfA2
MAFIKEITIKKWNHSEFSDPLIFKNGINLILGKNGSGKTSLLEMINLAANLVPQQLNGCFSDDSNGTHLTDIIINNGEETISVSNLKKDDSGEWSSDYLKENVRYITSQRKINVGGTAKNLLATIKFEDVNISNPGQSIDVAEEFNKTIMKELYLKITELSGDDKFLTEIEKDYKEGLIDFEKTLKIDLKKENAIYFVDYKEREVAINNLSSGEQEYLYFYSFLKRIQTDKEKIILIDEPELHLHSSQIRKLCELITNLAINNQVIIATHSGEILQHFISRANIILLNKGSVELIDNPEQMQKVLEDTGLPIDPSVFTSHWICAENSPTVSLFGGGPTTPDVLSWIFGKNLNKRYWSFGSNKDVAEGYGDGISSGYMENIKMTPILDGDKLIKKSSDYFPTSVPIVKKELAFFPFWELENIFLSDNLLNEVIPNNGKSGSEQFWDKVNGKKQDMLLSIKKTVIKNNLRRFSPDRSIGENPEVDFEKWKNDIQECTFELESVEEKFKEVLASKNWQWIPGKEALKFVLEIYPEFWIKIRSLQEEGKLKTIFEQNPDISTFISSVRSL